MTHRSFEAVRATIARIREQEALLDDEPFLRDRAWLMLPLAKREVVTRRLLALRAYDAIESPTAADALHAAKAAGVATTRLYQLVSHWRAHDRSPLSLVPHQALGMERASRLAAQATADAIAASIGNFLASDPLATTGRVISHVRRTWDGPGELPSDTALRIFHERAIRASRPAPGSLVIGTPGQPAEDDVVAERLAETLVIDHVAIRGLVAEEDGLQPTVTLAIDLWSGGPLGTAAVAGPPGPESLRLALEDASRRLGERTVAAGGAGAGAREKPRIVIATTFAKRWSWLVDELLADGFGIVERRDAFLQQGGAVRRLLGMRLGGLPLERRADRRERFDPRTTAVQPLDAIQRMLAAEVDAASDERVPRDAWAGATPFAIGAVGHGGPDVIEHDREVSPRRRGPGRPPGDPTARIRRAIERMAASRAPAGVRGARVEFDAEQVWHVVAEVDDDATRDATFVALARGAMELSSEHRVPIVVDVEVEKPSDRRRP